MKNDTGVRNHDIIITEGYYSSNDGGNSLYVVRAKTSSDIDNNGTITI